MGNGIRGVDFFDALSSSIAITEDHCDRVLEVVAGDLAGIKHEEFVPGIFIFDLPFGEDLRDQIELGEGILAIAGIVAATQILLLFEFQELQPIGMGGSDEITRLRGRGGGGRFGRALHRRFEDRSRGRPGDHGDSISAGPSFPVIFHASSLFLYL